MSTSPTLAPARNIGDIFPPVSKHHILNTSYAKWHTQYRTLTPKTRVIPLTPNFLTYIREDGILLPSDEDQITSLSDSDGDSEDEESNSDSGSTVDELAARKLPPNERFPALHQTIKDTIAELGGAVAPKLNWSSPKDAVFMSATNTLECRTPGQIYLLLKSSDFVTHDLEHVFDNCVDTQTLLPDGQVKGVGLQDIPYALVLRKWFNCNPSMEFRCFVRRRRLVGITQRDLNFFGFLENMKDSLRHAIVDFFELKLRDTFPDDSFVFDVYVPSTEGDSGTKRVWLMDINPFAPRTDPVLFSWLEILQVGDRKEEQAEGEVEMRIVKKGDPEAYSFNTPQYSTSKLPQEVVEAGLQGEEAVWEFASRWRDIVGKMEESKKPSSAQGSS